MTFAHRPAIAPGGPALRYLASRGGHSAYRLASVLAGIATLVADNLTNSLGIPLSVSVIVCLTALTASVGANRVTTRIRGSAPATTLEG